MAFRLKKDAPNGGSLAKRGQIVYPLNQTDYGISAEDSRNTGIPHRAVTFSHVGDYPFFTVPVEDLEIVPNG